MLCHLVVPNVGNSELTIKDIAERMPRVSCIDKSRSVSEGALYPHDTLFGCFYISTPAWVSVSSRQLLRQSQGLELRTSKDAVPTLFLFVSQVSYKPCPYSGIDGCSFY